MLCVVLMFYGCAASIGSAGPDVVVGSESQEITAESVITALNSLAGAWRVTSVQPSQTSALTAADSTSSIEVIQVVERGPARIALQHFLLIGDDPPVVLKHGRQVWEARPANLLRLESADGSGRTWRVLPYGEALSQHQGSVESDAVWVRTMYLADESPVESVLGVWRKAGNGLSWSALDGSSLIALNLSQPAESSDRRFNEHLFISSQPQQWSRQFTFGIQGKEDAPAAFSVMSEPVGSSESDFLQESASRYWQGTSAYWRSLASAWRSLRPDNGDWQFVRERQGMNYSVKVFRWAEQTRLGGGAIDENELLEFLRLHTSGSIHESKPPR
jgi:hypothetical protein